MYDENESVANKYIRYENENPGATWEEFLAAHNIPPQLSRLYLMATTVRQIKELFEVFS